MLGDDILYIMRKNFRICLVVPPGYQHSYAFLEMALLLKHSLMDLGHICELAANDLSPNATNILLGYHLLRYDESLKRRTYIPYQLEQLSADEGVFSDNLRAILQNAAEVWDYSPENIHFLQKQQVQARLLPVGYHKRLEQIPTDTPKDLDVLFYGSIAGRRKELLDKLTEEKELTSKALYGVYGSDRDRHISRARIILNVHFYSTRIFEAVRVSYLLNNRCLVVSEESDAYPYPGVDLCRVPYDKLIETCRGLLQEPLKMSATALENYEQFRERYRMVTLLKKILE
jgi:hypothetical protein